MKVESIAINLLNRSMYHSTSSGVNKTKFEEKAFFPQALAYIEDYCTKNGFDIINVTGENIRIYHLVKR
ncbi:MAG: hypothetical protein ACXADU_06980 [Promethearchaeota archaeon]|jgi:DNA-binding LacI/PurR family transcriptional regulator